MAQADAIALRIPNVDRPARLVDDGHAFTRQLHRQCGAILRRDLKSEQRVARSQSLEPFRSRVAFGLLQRQESAARQREPDAAKISFLSEMARQLLYAQHPPIEGGKRQRIPGLNLPRVQ